MKRELKHTLPVAKRPCVLVDSLETLMLWPCRVLDGLCPSLAAGGEGCASHELEDEERELRMKFLFMLGLDFNSDYSGWECPRWSMAALGQALIVRWGWTSELVTTGIRFLRSCDNGSIQREVLTAIGTDLDHGSSCSTGNMLHRLPKLARRYIRRAMPAEDAPGENKLEAHSHIHAWLLENRRWVFPRNAKARCSVHNRKCYVHSIMMQDIGTSSVSARRGRRLILNTAGVTCHAWSAEGKSEGDIHGSAVFNSIWQVERIALAEDLSEDGAFFECTPHYPVEDKIVKEVKATHWVVWVYVNPVVHGFPSRRSRVLAFMGNLLTLRWVGPSSATGIARDFKRRFSSEVCLSGSVFFCEDEETRWTAMFVLLLPCSFLW